MTDGEPLYEGDDDDRPRDVAAERAVLGALMLSPDTVGEVQELLNAEDFYRAPHAELFTVITGLYDAGKPTDPVAVAAELGNARLLRVGGAPYLHTLISGVPTAANAAYYADIVAGRAALARLADAGTAIRQLGLAAQADPERVGERAREIVETAVAPRGEDTTDSAWLSELVDEQLESWSEPGEPGIPSPFLDLNDVLGGGRGLLPGQLAVIAGRPGMGKSAALGGWCLSAAHSGIGVLLVSLEMSKREIVDRLIAATGTVRLSALMARELSEHDDQRARAAAAQLARLPIRIVDPPAMTTAQLRAEAKKMARSEVGLGFMALDYIQLLTASAKTPSRREDVDAFSRDLKRLAKEMRIPVAAAAQLNRATADRQDKTPQLTDLRESGSLEQDADVVMLVHRPDYYDHESPRSGEGDIILAKQRNGPTSTITVAHQLHYARFADLSRRVEMGAVA